MKPLSEKLEELSENVAAHGCEVCGECHVEETFTKELQAWLREADEYLAPYEEVDDHICPSEVRRNLLGTTQKLEQGEESSK